jgi:single-strand DNA-binding protein
MPTLNRVQLIGRLGKDPDERFTPTGKKVVSFSVAVDRFWKDKEGNRHQDTEWVNIEAWGRLGEICVKYLRKGSLVYLEGRLKTERYESEGQTRYFTKVVLQTLQFLDKKASSTEEEILSVAEDAAAYDAEEEA